MGLKLKDRYCSSGGGLVLLNGLWGLGPWRRGSGNTSWWVGRGQEETVVVRREGRMDLLLLSLVDGGNQSCPRYGGGTVVRLGEGGFLVSYTNDPRDYL